MLRKVMETIVTGYEQFFNVAFEVFVGDVDESVFTVHHKIQALGESLANRGISVDLSEYFLLKRLLFSEFDCIGEYRKNLSMISYIDGEEYVINMQKLLEFFGNLKMACACLSSDDQDY